MNNNSFPNKNRFFLYITIIFAVCLSGIYASGDRLPPDVSEGGLKTFPYGTSVDSFIPDDNSMQSPSPVTWNMKSPVLPENNLVFIQNDNLTAPYIEFFVRDGYRSYFFTDERIILSNQGKIEKTVELDKIFPDLTGSTALVPENLLPGRVQFFTGKQGPGWKSNLSMYGSVIYRDIYPGISLKIIGNSSVLTPGIIFTTGADMSDLDRAYVGEREVEQFFSSGRDMYSPADQGVIKNTSDYLSLQDLSRVSPNFEMEQPVEKPEEPGIPGRNLMMNLSRLVSSTYYGGSSLEGDTNIATDREGNVYITGRTSSIDLPHSADALYPVYGGGSFDVFVVKLNPDMSRAIYTTYLGGEDEDVGFGIVVDEEGYAYLTGYTWSTSFPTTSGAFQTHYAGNGNQERSDGGDAFISKLSPGGDLVYSTYLGGNSNDRGNGITIDKEKNVYITGISNSQDFPVSPGAYQNVNHGQGDVIVAKLNPEGNGLIYATFIGGGQVETGYNIKVNPKGDAFVTGVTWNGQFPTTSASFQPVFGGGMYDGFVFRINPDGNTLIYSSYLGGNSQDVGYGIAIDPSDNAYLTGLTDSSNFPATKGALQKIKKGPADAFLTVISPSGDWILSSTLIGGSGYDLGQVMALDGSGNAYLTGFTESSDFPVTPGAYMEKSQGLSDIFITVLDPLNSTLVYSSYLGGTGSEKGEGICVNASGKVFVSGNSKSINIPVTKGAFQSSNHGDSDSIVCIFGNTTMTLNNTIPGNISMSGQDSAPDTGIVFPGSKSPPSLLEFIWNLIF